MTLLPHAAKEIGEALIDAALSALQSGSQCMVVYNHELNVALALSEHDTLDDRVAVVVPA